MDKKSGFQLIQELVSNFKNNHALYVDAHSDYNETQLRTDFLNPFLAALGWDVFNQKKAPQHLREVVQEDTVEVEDEGEMFSKKPDYALRLGTERKFFVEAKRPSIPITTSNRPAFQLRRYGWNARMTISVLTNFDKLVIYDCRHRPQENDDARVARLEVYDYTEYVTKFDAIYNQLSREAVYSGQFDLAFGVSYDREGTELFDQYFLNQIEDWRERLALDIVQQNQTVTQEELNFLVQRLINRIIFLRICEDRELEKYRALQEAQTYAELKALFINADERYNSDLFDFIEDKLSLNVDVSSEVLIGIFRELYYPESPYVFSVVEASILGEIYERFLAKEILIDDGAITVAEKPEVVASGGVVPTPKYIVDAIIQKTLEPLCAGKSPSELAPKSGHAHLRVADIACGSGSFLLAAYEYLLNHYLEWYLQDGAEKHSDKVYESGQGRWCLTLPEKQRILLDHIFGVDVDQQAVEIARFSLLLKVLENERETSITAHLKQSKSRALPNLSQNIQCGNSLVDRIYFEYDSDALLSEEQFKRINPFDWDEAFPSVFNEGGFDAIVGNPPYIRIQNMRRYSSYEVDYYQSDLSPYISSQSDNFDKYSLFIERGLSLLKSMGRLGYIVPHKFFTIKSGLALRRLLSSGRHIAEIVHFGVLQVFGQQRSNYTCILELTKQAKSAFTVEHVTELTTWRRGQRGVIDRYASKEIGDAPWEFVSPQARCLFERLRDENPTTLEQVANIFVGVQTSADEIYIINPTTEATDSVQFTDVNGATWTIEKEILRPCLLDVELPPFCRPQPNTYIIFPYKTDGKLYTRDEMMKNFPNCWEYLVAYKGRLVQRSISGGTPETWYRYGRSQSLTKFNNEPKLIWPVLSLEPRYAYDDQNIVFTGGGNGPYYGLRPLESTSLSIHYLQAVLSHPVIEAMVRARGSSFRGGYKSHGKQFIKDLPIYNIDFANPTETSIHNQIVELVQKLITVTESEAVATVPTQRRRFAQQRRLLRQRIEKLLEELYGLNQADLDIVKPVDSDEEK